MDLQTGRYLMDLQPIRAVKLAANDQLRRICLLSPQNSHPGQLSGLWTPISVNLPINLPHANSSGTFSGEKPLNILSVDWMLFEIQDGYPEPLVQHKRHLCKNILHVFERYFFFSGPGGSSHCVISDKVNVFWILISPETLLSSVIRFLGLKKSRITLNLTPSSEPVATKKKKKLRESGKNPLWIHFGCRASFLSGSEANLTAH